MTPHNFGHLFTFKAEAMKEEVMPKEEMMKGYNGHIDNVQTTAHEDEVEYLSPQPSTDPDE